MSRYYGGWAPYVPVAERRRKALLAMDKMRKKGHPVAPVTIEGRQIATTFWGRAWCDNMESYRDYENRLPRGRSYVRNGSVVDLQIATGRITALVAGSELYTVTVTIKEAVKTQWRAICTACAGGIDSVVELLQGRFSKGVMERLCRQDSGLFPRPSEIRFSCTCPDDASLCKHVAATLYGVGARLDHTPELLFRLRAVDANDLVTHLDGAVAKGKTGDKLLELDDVSALFGLDMADSDAASPPKAQPAAAKAAKPVVAVAKAKPPARKLPAAKPITVKPIIVKPSTVKPSTVKPGAAKPRTAGAIIVKPATMPAAAVKAAKPVVAVAKAQPPAAKPSIAKPETANPKTAKAIIVKPAPVAAKAGAIVLATHTRVKTPLPKQAPPPQPRAARTVAKTSRAR